MSYVVDASVAVAWFIPGESWGAKARRLREDYAEGRVMLYAPNILLYELNNSLWKAVKRGLMSVEVATDCVEVFSKVSPELLTLNLDEQLEALRMAVKEGISFYDSSYIVTTRKTASTLVSADSDLVSVARKYVDAILVDELP